MEDKQIIDIIKDALEDKKGENICVLDIRNLTVVADYFVICDGSSVNQVKALADNVEEKLAKVKIHPKQTEGYQTANWILLDYGNIIIHIFDRESRDFYNLDKMWADADSI